MFDFPTMSVYYYKAYLKDIVGSVPDHCNEINVTIKQVTQICLFGFPVHIKVMFTLCCVQCVVVLCLKKKHIYLNLKILYLLKTMLAVT